MSHHKNVLSVLRTVSKITGLFATIGNNIHQECLKTIDTQQDQIMNHEGYGLIPNKACIGYVNTKGVCKLPQFVLDHLDLNSGGGIVCLKEGSKIFIANDDYIETLFNK